AAAGEPAPAGRDDRADRTASEWRHALDGERRSAGALQRAHLADATQRCQREFPGEPGGMNTPAFKIGDRVRIADPNAPGCEIYPRELVFRVVGLEVRDGRDRLGACCGPFPGYPYGVERWDYVERWSKVPEVVQ